MGLLNVRERHLIVGLWKGCQQLWSFLQGFLQDFDVEGESLVPEAKIAAFRMFPALNVLKDILMPG